MTWNSWKQLDKITQVFLFFFVSANSASRLSEIELSLLTEKRAPLTRFRLEFLDKGKEIHRFKYGM